MAYSPDGKILATGSSSGIVQLWDAVTQRRIGEPLPGATGWVYTVAFSLDGKIVAAGQDSVVRLWDVATHQPIGKPLTGDVSNVESIAFSPDADLLAAGHYDGTVQLWDVASGQQMGTALHAGEVLSVAFAGTARCWPPAATTALTMARCSCGTWARASRSAPLSERPSSPPSHIFDGFSVAFSPDGTMLAAGEGDGVVQLWNVISRKEIGSLSRRIPMRSRR